MDFLKTFGHFFFFQIWFVVGLSVLPETKGLCFRGLGGFLLMDIICVFAYLYGKRKRIRRKSGWNVLPMKWFGIVTLVVFLCEIHSDEYFPMCIFLNVTTLIWYLHDLYERYRLWKESHPRL